MLRGAAAADAMEKMKNDRHAGLPRRHVKSVRRFVADLRPSFKYEAAGADIDDRPETSHGCPCRQTAETQLRYRRAHDSIAVFLHQLLINVTARAQAQKRAVDQMHAFVSGHDFMQRLELGFVIGKLSHHRLSA